MKLFCVTATHEDGKVRRHWLVSRFAASQRHHMLEGVPGVRSIVTDEIDLPTSSYASMAAFLNQVEATSPAPEDTAEPSPLEKQVGGDHYKKLGQYQPWEVLRRWLTPEEFRGYMKGQAIAYLARERDKGGDQDIAKAEHYLSGLLEMQEPIC